jgi:hypothetical protein
MLSCKKASQLISQSLDRKLTMRERFALKLHLFICSKCARFNQQLQTLRLAIQQWLGAVELNNSIEMSSEAKKRITDLVSTHYQQ